VVRGPIRGPREARSMVGPPIRASVGGEIGGGGTDSSVRGRRDRWWGHPLGGKGIRRPSASRPSSHRLTDASHTGGLVDSRCTARRVAEVVDCRGTARSVAELAREGCDSPCDGPNGWFPRGFCVRRRRDARGGPVDLKNPRGSRRAYPPSNSPKSRRLQWELHPARGGMHVGRLGSVARGAAVQRRPYVGALGGQRREARVGA
jgi:hypothetical protein